MRRDTIMRLGRRLGDECAKLLDSKMRKLQCRNLAVDEIWACVGKKQPTSRPAKTTRASAIPGRRCKRESGSSRALYTWLVTHATQPSCAGNL